MEHAGEPISQCNSARPAPRRSVGIVIAQAAGRDLYSGSKLVQYYGQLAVLGGLAAIIGPFISG